MYFSIPFSFISMPFISKSTLLCLFFVVTLPSVLNKVKDMMWLLLAFLSAALLGFYDVFKKQSLKDNAVIPVLFLNTLFSSLIFLPFIVLSVWRPGILENSIFYVPVAVGERAKMMYEKENPNIRTVRPLRDGVIADFNACEQMMRGLIKKVNMGNRFFSPSLRMVTRCAFRQYGS